MGVSRGSFYWHFADIGAFHAAILKHWREVAAEQIIADVEAASERPRLAARCCCAGCSAKAGAGERGPHLGSVDPAARAAVQAIDRRRLGYIESLLRRSPAYPPDMARARAQILYWAFLGFALSDSPCRKRRQQAVLDELLRMACDSVHDTLSIGYAKESPPSRRQHMNPRPNASKAPSIQNCWKFWSAR